MSGIRQAQTLETDERAAAQAFYAAVAQPEMALVLFFCSVHYNLDALAAELRALFGDVPLVGCTTAGEVGPQGLQDASLTGVSFSRERFSAEVGWLDGLEEFEHEQGRELAQQLRQNLGRKVAPLSGANCFGVVLIDGLTTGVEAVARIWQQTLGSIQLVGGAAGGGLDYKPTMVYAGGHFRAGRAACVLIATELPFALMKSQHFEATEQRMVVTEADPEHRQIQEINGLPAAEEYARMVGVPVEAFTSELFAANPLVVMINGNHYVRAIRQANADGSLSLMCSIERGVVLRLARGVDLVENLKGSFEKVRRKVGEPALTLGFDCVYRRLEIEQRNLRDVVQELLQRNRTVGFCTYGEQLRGIHINQTFTCVVIGSGSSEEGDE